MQQLLNSELIKKIKRSDFFETLRHSKNYFFADAATRALSVLSIPVFTRLLTEADYGIVAVFNAYVGIFLIILSLNAHTAVSRYYYEETDDFDEFVGTTLVLLGLIFGVTVLLFTASYRHIADLLELPGLLPLYMVIICLLEVLRSVYIQILIPRKKSGEVALIRVVNGFALIIVAVALVYTLEENRYLGRIWARLLISFIFSFYFMVKMRDYFKFSLRYDHLKYIAYFSLPLVPTALSSVVLAQFDRIMISNTLDAASAGLYSLGYSIGMLLLMVIGATQTAIVPDFYKFLDKREYGRLDVLVRRVFSVVTVAALGLVFFAREMGMILADEKFYPGLSVVPIVTIGYIFYAMFLVYGRYISYKKKTYYTLVVVFTAGILNIALNALFIPRYGYVAAAYTTLVSYFVLFLNAWVAARMVFRERITPLWMIWESTAAMFLFIALGYVVSGLDLSLVVFWIIKIAILIVFGIAVFWREIRFLYQKLV